MLTREIIFSLAYDTCLLSLSKIVALILNFTCHLLISHNYCLNVYSLNALKNNPGGRGCPV